MRTMCRHLVIVIALCLTSPVAAALLELTAGKPKSAALPGAWAAFIDPANGKLYSDESGTFGIPVILDTGASSVILSESNGSEKTPMDIFGLGLEIRKTGETYVEEGIGGEPVPYNVSVPTRLLLAPIAVGDFGARDLNNYSDAGQYKFQIKQRDNEILGFKIPIDLVGTAVLNQSVLHVQPNVTAFTDVLGISYRTTNLLGALPDEVVGPDVLRVPITYKDVVPGMPPVTVNTTPFVPGARIVDNRKGAGEQAEPRDLAFWTGAGVTIISDDFAQEIGIDLLNEMPVSQEGIDDIQLLGYKVDQLILPLKSGNELAFRNATVFVMRDLPGNLSGVIGMNLFGPSYAQVGPMGPLDEIEGPFSDYYVDAMNKELVLLPIEPLVSLNPGDLDGDGDVDFRDFSGLAFNFTGTITPPAPSGTGGKTRAEGDFDGDGDVDFIDFSTLSGNFTGSIAAPASDAPAGGEVHLTIDLNTGAITFEASSASLSGYSIRSPDSNIVPDPDVQAAPFQFYLLNAPHEVTAGTVGMPTELAGSLTLDITWDGDREAFENLVFEYTRFGEVSPVAGVIHLIPEPTTMMLLAAGGWLVLRRRRCA